MKENGFNLTDEEIEKRLSSIPIEMTEDEEDRFYDIIQTECDALNYLDYDKFSYLEKNSTEEELKKEINETKTRYLKK